MNTSVNLTYDCGVKLESTEKEILDDLKFS